MQDDTLIPLSPTSFSQAIGELAHRDPDLTRVIIRWGPPPFWTHAPGFPGLILAILSQQVSVESANAAYEKLIQRVSPVTPACFLDLDDVTLKAIGFGRLTSSSD